jgi:hypothetical protein
MPKRTLDPLEAGDPGRRLQGGSQRVPTAATAHGAAAEAVQAGIVSNDPGLDATASGKDQ